MPKLPRVSGEDLARILEKMGFFRLRQKGSHLVMKKQSSQGAVGCVIPLHKELAIGTLRSILRQAQITPEEFLKYC